MMSKPVLRGRLGTAIMYSSVWEYNFLFITYKEQKKRLCASKAPNTFPCRSSPQPAQPDTTDWERREADRVKRKVRTMESGLSHQNTQGKHKHSRKPSVYTLSSNCTVQFQLASRDT